MNIDSKEGIEAQRGGGAYTYVLAALVSAAYSAPYGGGCRLSETAGEDGCVDHWKADFFRTRADRATLLLRVALARAQSFQLGAAPRGNTARKSRSLENLGPRARAANPKAGARQFPQLPQGAHACCCSNC